MSEAHDDEYCEADLVAHLAGIEAGWTLGKPWKARDSDAKEAENRAEIREMLARWSEHGIMVVPAALVDLIDRLDNDGIDHPDGCECADHLTLLALMDGLRLTFG